MNKIILLILVLPFIFSCSDDNKVTPSQDYTSFQIKNENKKITYRNVVSGYRLSNDTLKLIAYMGDMSPESLSVKVIFDYNKVKEVEFFCDVYTDKDVLENTYKLGTLKIEENKNNMLTIPFYVSSFPIDKTDPTQYPQFK
ncbi:MAG: hypothetical protein ACLVKO_09645 [Dysgonomonas sp.]